MSILKDLSGGKSSPAGYTAGLFFFSTIRQSLTGVDKVVAFSK
jgi:hypothetical protein